MPDYGKIEFLEQETQSFEKFFPNALKQEIELLSEMLRYEGRISLEKVLFFF